MPLIQVIGEKTVGVKTVKLIRDRNFYNGVKKPLFLIRTFIGELPFKELDIRLNDPHEAMRKFEEMVQE